MSLTQTFIRPDQPSSRPSRVRCARAPVRNRLAATTWLMLGGVTVGTLDILSAIIYWARDGVAPAHILQYFTAWLVGPPAFGGGFASAIAGALLYALLMWGVAAVYYAFARIWPLLLRRPLLCGGLYGALAYLAIFQVLAPFLTGSHGAADPAWIATCLVVYTTLVGMPCAFFVRMAVRASAAKTRIG